MSFVYTMLCARDPDAAVAVSVPALTRYMMTLLPTASDG